jgi:hypothetical protein
MVDRPPDHLHRDGTAHAFTLLATALPPVSAYETGTSADGGPTRRRGRLKQEHWPGGSCERMWKSRSEAVPEVVEPLLRSPTALASGPSSEGSETAPFVREQRSRPALPLLVRSGRLMLAVRDAHSQAKQQSRLDPRRLRGVVAQEDLARFPIVAAAARMAGGARGRTVEVVRTL